MPKVAGDIIFGTDKKSASVDYAAMRLISDENEKIELLECRIKTFFTNQVEPLSKAKSAFPLVVMTCVGIETLGEIFFRDDKDSHAKRFVNACHELDPLFKKKPMKTTISNMNKIWPSNKMDKINSTGDVLHNFLRNAMIHGYQAQAMYLSYEDTDTFEEKEQDGHFIINPDWLWLKYKIATDKLFKMAIKNIHKQKRKKCIEYFDDIVS